MKFSKRTKALDWEKNTHQPSRRDILKHSLASGIWYCVPSVLSQILMAKQAMADAGFNNHYVVQLDLQNGYSSVGQFFARPAAGNLGPKAFSALGVNSTFPSNANALYTGMGLPFWGSGDAAVANVPGSALVSKLAQGILLRGGDAIAKTRASAIMLRSADDTNTNKMGLASAVVQAGCRGSITGNFANSNTQSGLNAQEYISGTKAGFARSVDDILNAARISGLTHLPTGSINELVAGIEKVSAADLKKLDRLPADEAVQALAQKSLAKTKDFVVPPPGLDGRLDTSAQTAFGIAAGSAATDRNVVIASLLSGLFRDYFGVASIQLNGYDYHNTGLANTEAMDLAAGELIGRILNYATLLGKDLTLVVTSAGGVGGGSETATDLQAARAWNGDRGVNAACLVFRHQASGAVTQLKTQVGFFLPDGGTSTLVNSEDPIRGDLNRAMGAVLANIMMAGRREGLISSLLPGMFTAAELEKIRLFG